jgi:hypothetical protein
LVQQHPRILKFHATGRWKKLEKKEGDQGLERCVMSDLLGLVSAARQASRDHDWFKLNLALDALERAVSGPSEPVSEAPAAEAVEPGDSIASLEGDEA